MKGPLIDVAGAIDLHCHPSPDLFPRLADDVDVARHAAGMGLRAVMLKSHFEPTAGRAWHTGLEVPGVRVFGGIVLNHAVGGVNPGAVEAALRLGGREVWMPTVDAAYHAERHGGTAGYDVQTAGAGGESSAREPLTVVDAEGTLTPAALEVLDLVAQHDAILGTCHLSPKEISALVGEARRRGVQRIVVTHPFFKVPDLTVDELKALTDLGAYAEFGYCTISPMWRYATPPRVAEAIQGIGADRCLLVSDTGQRHNPMPAEALRIFAQSVFECGVPEEDVMRLIRDNPRQLLDLPESEVAEVDLAAIDAPAGDGSEAGPR